MIPGSRALVDERKQVPQKEPVPIGPPKREILSFHFSMLKARLALNDGILGSILWLFTLEK